MKKIDTLTAFLLAACIGATCLLAACSREKPREVPESADETIEGDRIVETVEPQFTQGQRLPKMIDIGRGKCIPCKMMEPILKELKQAYQGRVVIEIINLDDDAEAVEQYGIRIIPTQIFFDSSGAEVSRHEGFLPKDVIVEKFHQLGVEHIAE